MSSRPKQDFKGLTSLPQEYMYSEILNGPIRGNNQIYTIIAVKKFDHPSLGKKNHDNPMVMDTPFSK